MNLFQFNPSEYVCELLYRNSKHSIFAHIVCIFALFYLFQDITPFGVLLTWFLILSAALILKFAISWFYYRPSSHNQNVVYWYKLFIVGSLVLGVAWGGAVITLFPEGHASYQLLILIISIGLAGGAALTQSVDKLAVLVFSQPILLATVARLFYVDDSVYHSTAWLLLFLDLPVVIAALNSSDASYRLHESAVVERNMNAEKTDFLANMSHEIRTPMNAVVGIGYLLEKTDLSAKQKNYISKLQRASNSLLGIINSILDFSRIEAGQMELEETSFDLHGVLETVTAHVETQAQKKSLNFSVDIDEDIDTHFIGDPLRLAQVLTNLSANGVKFTQEGGVHIQVARLDAEDDRIHLEFRVKDTGAGIEEKDKDRLFDSFTQLNRSDTRKHGGTGLGLTISQRLLGMMNSKIEIESELGEGATFFFSIWLEVAEVEAEGSAESEGSSVALQFIPELCSKNVLVVDDDELNQEIAKEMLNIYGLNVQVASSAKEALWLLSESLPDLIFMDLQMPGMTGYEALDAIHDNPAWSDIPVIALTANARVVERRKALSYGMDGFLTKPIQPHLLKQMLLDWIPHDDGGVSLLKKNAMPSDITQEKIESDVEIQEKLNNVVEMLGSKSASNFFNKVVAVIVKEKPELLRSLDDHQWEAAAQLAHRLKGSMNLYGSTALEELLTQIDDKTIAPDEVDDICITLTGEFDLIQQLIKGHNAFVCL